MYDPTMRIISVAVFGLATSLSLAVSTSSHADPVVLPPPHALSPRGSAVLEIVPPDGARICNIRLRASGGNRVTRAYRVTLGSPSRRVSWRMGDYPRGTWIAEASCGTSDTASTSLGIGKRTIVIGRRGRAEGQIMRSGSVSVDRGWIPAGPPPPIRDARASDVSDEIETGLAKSCNSAFMRSAYAVGYGYGTRIGFSPKLLAHDNPDVNGIWADLERCIRFPALTSSERDSLYKQMVCHVIFAIVGGAGVAWDFEAWRADPSWSTALNPKNRCQNWGNVPDAAVQFGGHIVQGSLDTSGQKEAWLVDNLNGIWIRRHILTSTAYTCLKTSGAPGPDLLASDFLIDEIPTIGPDVSDNNACPASGGGGSVPSPTNPNPGGPPVVQQNRQAITSYNRLEPGAPHWGYFDVAWQPFTAKSNTITTLGVTVGNRWLSAGETVAYGVRVRLCAAQPAGNGSCPGQLAEAMPAIVNYGATLADIGDVPVTVGTTYWIEWLQPSSVAGETWVTYWWAGGGSIASSEELQALVRGYDR